MSAGKVFKFAEPGSRILREFARERELERALRARSMKVHRSPAFAGAAIDRLSASLANWSGAVNADLDGSLVTLRARARRLAANVDHGRRFLSLVATNIVGCGPTLQVRATNRDGKLDASANNAIESHWAKWFRQCDVTGRMSGAHMLRLLVKATARDGEALVRRVANRRLPYGMALQALEIDRLDESINARLDNGNIIRQGVELEPTLRPVAYYVKQSHPGESWVSRPAQVERVPANEIYHLFLQERAEQVRGYTWYHAVLARANMLDAFEESAVVAARVGASKVGVFQKKDDTPAASNPLAGIADGQESDGTPLMDAQPGEFMRAPEGYELASWDPDYPHANFESFLKTCLRGIAAGLDVATHNLTGDMTDVNYSSARIAELAERELWTMLQDWLFESFLVPVYQDWLASSLLMGQITFDESGKTLPAERLSKFVDVSRFQGRRWGWVDPLKEAQAYKVLLDEGLISRTQIAASQGREFEDVIDELASELAYAKGKNVPLGQITTIAPTSDAGDEPNSTKRPPPRARS